MYSNIFKANTYYNQKLCDTSIEEFKKVSLPLPKINPMWIFISIFFGKLYEKHKIVIIQTYIFHTSVFYSFLTFLVSRVGLMRIFLFHRSWSWSLPAQTIHPVFMLRESWLSVPATWQFAPFSRKAPLHIVWNPLIRHQSYKVKCEDRTKHTKNPTVRCGWIRLFVNFWGRRFQWGRQGRGHVYCGLN